MNIKRKAIAVTDGQLHTDSAKTAHGLVRGSDRFELVAVIDKNNAGKDAGEVIDGIHRGIPVVSTIDEALNLFDNIAYLIIGVATKGGVLSHSLLEATREGISNNLSIVNGLHQSLCNLEDIVKLANEHQVELIDIRKTKTFKELHFWTGKVFEINTPIVAVLGMDCALGKRTTARMLTQAYSKQGKKAQMIYTGQTGWMQGNKYGFIFDSTINDFVSGELEHAIITCAETEKPDVIFLEGQSSLRNPSGPCGLELIISGNAKQVVLVHDPSKKNYGDNPSWGNIPSVASEIEIIEKFGTKVIGLALNTRDLSLKEAKVSQAELEKLLKIPVALPIEEGIDKLIAAIKLS